MNALESSPRNGRLDVIVVRFRSEADIVEDIFSELSWCCVLESELGMKTYATSLFSAEFDDSRIVVGLYGSDWEVVAANRHWSTAARAALSLMFILGQWRKFPRVLSL